VYVLYRDKQKELSRKRKLETFRETGEWPENKNIKLRKAVQTTSWSIAKDKRAKKLEKKTAKHVRNTKGLSENEISAMEKSLPSTLS
jgi:hypothetical protein